VQQQAYEVRVKLEQPRFSQSLTERGCTVKTVDDTLLVTLPEGRNEGMLWELAAAEEFQIRHLRPRRSTLEDVFLTAINQ
jgi:ABC-2 type transport system ATP-binding protein